MASMCWSWVTQLLSRWRRSRSVKCCLLMACMRRGLGARIGVGGSREARRPASRSSRAERKSASALMLSRRGSVLMLCRTWVLIR